MKKYILLAAIIGICSFSVIHAQGDTTKAASFDVAAATQKYLDMLSPAQKAKSDAYFEGGYWLILWTLLYTLAVGFVFLRLGLSRWIKKNAQRVKNVNLQNLIYGLQYILLVWLLSFPMSVYQDFYREHQYNLSNLSFTGWLIEDLQGLGLATLFGSILLVILYIAIRPAGRRWWIWGAGITIAFSMFAAFIAPVFIAPIFNQYKPLADGPLKQQILSMARANEIPADNVYQFDASKQSDRVSANVSGLGSTTRISLNDNLLKRCTPAEIRAVMGHEMGHYVMNHVNKSILSIGVLLFLSFALASWSFNKIVLRWGESLSISGITDIGGLPLLAVIFAVITFVSTPISNTIIRTQETEADMFGLNAAREPDAEAHVDIMLSEYRKLDPGYWEEVFFYDHPSGRRRVHMAMQWKAENITPPNLPKGEGQTDPNKQK